MYFCAMLPDLFREIYTFFTDKAFKTLDINPGSRNRGNCPERGLNPNQKALRYTIRESGDAAGLRRLQAGQGAGLLGRIATFPESRTPHQTQEEEKVSR